MALESYYVRRVEKSRLISLASSYKLHSRKYFLLHTRSHLYSGNYILSRSHIQYPKNWFSAARLKPFPILPPHNFVEKRWTWVIMISCF
jgi:hypothetical protein